MAAKHAVRSSSPGATQFFFSFAAVVLAVLTAWVAVRAAGPVPAGRQPTVVLPSMPQVPMGWSSASVAPLVPARGSAPDLPAPPPTPSLSSSSSSPSSPFSPATSGTSPVPPASHPPTAKPTTKPAPPPPAPPSPSRTTEPPAQENALSVVIDIYSSWEQGYTTGAKLTNSGAKGMSWTVRISHSGQQNLSLVNYWNAAGRQSGDTFIFTGYLSPGTSVWWGWQAGKSGHGNAHPDGCTLVGGKCTMR